MKEYICIKDLKLDTRNVPSFIKGETYTFSDRASMTQSHMRLSEEVMKRFFQPIDINKPGE